jgi:quinone-modifying oxidoreductase subunit QmoB
VSDTEKTFGVWICTGCDIGASLDVEALEKVAAECGVKACRSHACLCGDDGVEQLKSDLNNGANGLLLAACSPRFKADAFTFDGRPVERVNLREFVSWSHAPNDEDTQMLAADYLRMGIARMQRAEVPQPFEAETDKTILVVGGGETGMSAALDAARAGYDVVLVEKEPQLGGWLRKFAALFPAAPPYRDPEPVDLDSRIAEIERHDRITVHLGATINSISGQPGQFDVSVQTNGTATRFRVGAIVQATGWKPYDASRTSRWRSSSRRAKCSAPPTASPPGGSRSSSAPARATPSTCPTARASAAA